VIKNKRMDKKLDITIFIFRRDLRLNDNIGLNESLKISKQVLPLFIFTPKQLSNSNKFKSSNAIQFMIESLYDLNSQIKKRNKKCKLWIDYGDEIQIIKKICSVIKISAIFVNEDYTPYSLERDNRIKNFCKKNNKEFRQFTDILLIGDSELSANNGNKYHVFSQFYYKAKNIEIMKPKNKFNTNFLSPINRFEKHTIEKNGKVSVKKQIL